MSSKKQKWWEQYLDWLDDSYTNLLLTILALVMVGIFGFWLAIIRPGQVIAAQKQVAQLAIDNAHSGETDTVARYTREAKWYAAGKGYVDDLWGKLEAAQTEISVAEQLLAEVDSEPWNPDAQVEKARKAEESAEAASSLIREVTNTLDDNKELREGTRENLATAQSQSELVDTLIIQAEQRFAAESPQYLAKYTGVYKAELQSAFDRRDETHNHLLIANAYMPADEDSGKGDPHAAQVEINLANAAILTSGEHVGKVHAGLDYQQEAFTNASPRTTEAVRAYYGADNDTGAVKYVEAIRQQTRFWLKDSDKSLANALIMLQEAQAFLAAQGPIDNPAAYEAAKLSLSLSSQARSQADNEVATAKAANDEIVLIATRVNQVTNHINLAAGAEQTLRVYHASPTWASVADNLQQAQSRLQSAQLHKGNAEKLVALDTQLFTEGKQEAEAGLIALTEADGLASSIESARDYLEGWRSHWGGCESSASSAVEGARGTVNQYANYSSSGVSKFNSATSSLTSARSNAASGYYEEACSQAGTAASQASSAASQAKSDYDDEMDRQRREREAAQRQAEEAARRAREQSQQSPSYGGGYSSGGNGGGYNSGGGGSSGGSDYGGGSSDSDY